MAMIFWSSIYKSIGLNRAKYKYDFVMQLVTKSQFRWYEDYAMALYVNTNVSSINAQRKLANSTLALNTSYQRLSSVL